MNLHKRNIFGTTAAEQIRGLASEASRDDYVSIHEFDGAARSFGFEGAEYEEFIRLCVRATLATGASPTRFIRKGPLVMWVDDTALGQAPEEIEEATIRWLRETDPDEICTQIMFGMPEMRNRWCDDNTGKRVDE